ncbi:SMC-Scp complex subunit ScpB [candidate division KSB1 bacterium]
MAKNDNKQIIEALIFASDFPISIKKIGQIIEDLSDDEIVGLLEDIWSDYNKSEKGFYLQKVAGGYEFVTRPEFKIWVSRLYAGRRKNRLSRAALETVAIVAYNKKITRSNIEKIRGVDSGGTIRTLLDRRLIDIAGREKSPGRPIIYKTTDEFLHYFGIESDNDLPRLEEIEEIIQHSAEHTNGTVEQLSFESGDSSEEEVRSSDQTGSGLG